MFLIALYGAALALFQFPPFDVSLKNLFNGVIMQ